MTQFEPLAWAGGLGDNSGMKKLSLRAIAILLSLLSAGLGLLLLLADPLALQTLRHQGYDQYQRWQPRVYEPAPVRIVDIDEASLERVGQWPWPRTRIADMVNTLNAAGVAAIGFDVVFAEPDRTSPRAIANVWPLTPQVRETVLQLPDHDEVLSQTLQGKDVVLGFAVQRDQEVQAGQRVPSAPYRYVWVGNEATSALHGFTTAVPALPALDAARRGNLRHRPGAERAADRAQGEQAGGAAPAGGGQGGGSARGAAR
jgi:adenylate cyclase